MTEFELGMLVGGLLCAVVSGCSTYVLVKREIRRERNRRPGFVQIHRSVPSNVRRDDG